MPLNFSLVQYFENNSIASFFIKWYLKNNNNRQNNNLEYNKNINILENKYEWKGKQQQKNVSAKG